MQALVINNRYQFSYYDSLIIAAALEAEASVLYTEDMQHSQRIGSLTIINPFLADFAINERMAEYRTVD
jgi:predicted nucleic acid-binding protein